MAGFYRNLHTFFAPLHRPLSSSTDPAKVAARLAAAKLAPPGATSSDPQPIFDLIHDPGSLTLLSSVPNIPEPGTLAAEGLGPAAHWTRLEALSAHAQILAAVAATRGPGAADQLERTAKTSRGWWVVWMR
ncbi:MAG: hypothetical protein INR71_08665, partial [Terriglobus roseus]|nr:hypothetical protein [Terriglobus roseus]